MNAAKPTISNLSFVADRDGVALPLPAGLQERRCFWNVTPSGHYGEDCRRGEKLAIEYLEFEAADGGGPGRLQMIMGDMPRGKLSGVEVGFLTLVSYAAAAGKHEALRVHQYWEKCRRERVGAWADEEETDEVENAYEAVAPAPALDSLLGAIAKFRKGLADYNRQAGDFESDEELDALADRTYVGPWQTLAEWRTPATSREEALEALRLSVEEDDDFGDSRIAPLMVKAALAYFESEVADETTADRRWEELDLAHHNDVFLHDLEDWRQAYDAAMCEDDIGPLWHAKEAIADRIMKRPADSVIGIAVKLLVLSGYGEFDLEDDFLEAVLADARRIVPVPPPSTLAQFRAEQNSAA